MNAQSDFSTATSPPAEEITHLEARIRCRLNGLVADFRLEWQDGGWVLSGHARTYYAKQFAQEAVMNQSNRPLHANRIEVR